MDVEEDDAGVPEAAQGPAQQPERLLRRPPHGHVDPRLAVALLPAAAAAEAWAGAGQRRRRRRAQDLHHPGGGVMRSSLSLATVLGNKQSQRRSRSERMYLVL